MHLRLSERLEDFRLCESWRPLILEGSVARC
jgi:hypothetical protein